jgi:coenzyme F420-reducing hydrogenase delta subunit
MSTYLRKTILAVLAPMKILSAQSPSATAQNADVPVAKVVLFSSGVGYFEHTGTVHGNGNTQLRFKTSQINDILKSIMLEDQDGGRVGAISYPSQDPLAKTLKSFQVDITQNPSQADLLNQLRGARVTIQTKGTTLSGTILGVESQKKTSEKSEGTTVAVLNLFTGASIRSVELPSINSLSIEDPQLQEELTKALAALVQARDQDKKPVTIGFTGTGDRRVRIGYVVETPIWKTSYRLLLNDKGTSGKLQGWAIVENQTESDWKNVSLALVSGRPISFTMDLYQPLYSTRPAVVPELYPGLRPQVYETDLMGKVSGVPMQSPAPTGAARRIGYGPDGRPLPVALNEIVVTGMGAEYDQPLDMASSVQSVAQAAKLGELFQYTVGNVTLARQKSAMLPIITDSIELERVSIYNSAVLATNPLNGVWFKNTTGKHLLQGPFTILDGGGYAGDARIDNVPPGQTRLLSYGIDLDVSINDHGNFATSNVTSAKINKGMLVLSRKLVSTQTYAIDNKADKTKSLVIEHPARRGWKLIDTQAAFETTPSHLRFKVSALPKKMTYFVVKEENVQNEMLSMLPMDLVQLVSYSKTGEISPDVRDAIGKAIQLKQGMADVDRRVVAASQRINEITIEQNRIRENMKTVAQSGQYYERLLAKLNEQESQIEKLQVERVDLTTQRDTLRRELEEYLNGLTLGA